MADLPDLVANPALLPQTTVPVWPDDAPPLSPGAAGWTLISLASRTDEVIARWRDAAAQGQPSCPVTLVRVDATNLAMWLEDVADWFAQEASRHVTGWRLAVTGEEQAVLALAEAARSGGLLPSEIVLHAEYASGIAIYCPVCGALSPGSTSFGTTVRCRACHALLVVHDHHARRMNAYLGTPIAETGSDIFHE